MQSNHQGLLPLSDIMFTKIENNYLVMLIHLYLFG